MTATFFTPCSGKFDWLGEFCKSLNGVGIAPIDLEKMFEPFFSTKIGAGGTGLGLAIVHNLVTKTLGGEIRVSSVLGQGTHFEIELPQTLA